MSGTNANLIRQHAGRLALLLLLCACTEDQVRVTTIAELAANPRAYSGQQVKVAGMLRSYPEPLHFWIEDTELNRVAVEFHQPLDPLVGQRIEVQGRFSYQLSAGRKITVDRLTTPTANDRE